MPYRPKLMGTRQYTPIGLILARMCEVLRNHLKSTSQTQQQFADRVGVRQETISKAVRGKVSVKLLPLIADASGIPAKEFRPKLAELFQ